LRPDPKTRERSQTVLAQGRYRPGPGAALQRWTPVRGRAAWAAWPRGDQAAHRNQGDRRVDRAGRASHRLAAARCHPHRRPSLAPLDPGALRPRSPPDPAEVADLAPGWRPYRSLASSLLLAAAKSSSWMRCSSGWPGVQAVRG